MLALLTAQLQEIAIEYTHDFPVAGHALHRLGKMINGVRNQVGIVEVIINDVLLTGRIT